MVLVRVHRQGQQFRGSTLRQRVLRPDVVPLQLWLQGLMPGPPGPLQACAAPGRRGVPELVPAPCRSQATVRRARFAVPPVGQLAAPVAGLGMAPVPLSWEPRLPAERALTRLEPPALLASCRPELLR